MTGEEKICKSGIEKVGEDPGSEGTGGKQRAQAGRSQSTANERATSHKQSSNSWLGLM